MLFYLAVINVGVGGLDKVLTNKNVWFTENWSKVQVCQTFILPQKGFNGQQRTYFYQKTLN